MTNTYVRQSDDYCVKRKPKIGAEQQRGCATLPKDLGSAGYYNNNNFGYNEEGTKQPRFRTNSIGFKEAVKTKFTVFGTLLRPNKLRRKKNKSNEDINSEANTKEENDEDIFTKHSKPLNYDENGNLISGRMNNMIQLMTPTNEYYPDQKYIFTFLLCARLFMPPERLLRKLIDNVKTVSEEDKENERAILKKFVQLLLDWSKLFPYDFKDKLMMSQFNKFSTMLKTTHPDLSVSLNYIAIHLVQKFKELLAYVECTRELEVECDESDKTILFDVCIDPCVVAEQLTLIELEKMSKLTAEQFVEKFIAEDITCSRMDLTEINNHATTLELYVSWFNRLSQLVATEICSCPKKGERVRTINFFIEVARHCFKIGNFNSLMAIITGLNMNAVGRMSKSWQRANKGKFRKLESEMDPIGNFARYRENVRIRREQNTVDIVIPVFSLLVKDIYFLNEGVKHKLPNGMINYDKFRQLSSHIDGFLSRRNKRCYYLRNEHVIRYLLDTPVMGENGLYKSSFEVEKPENNFERDRFQSVRMKMGHPVL